jgi:hypothetical protein
MRKGLEREIEKINLVFLLSHDTTTKTAKIKTARNIFAKELGEILRVVVAFIPSSVIA